MAKEKDDESLKRLGGGRWQTKDGRFTIEPQGGTWSLVDGEQTDELGLPLLRGPFRSLTAAKEAIAGARIGETPASPLADRAAEIQQRTAAAPARPAKPKAPPRARADAKAAADTPAAGETAGDKAPRPTEAPAEVPDGVRIETIYVIEAPYARDAAKRRPAVRHEHLTHAAELLADGRLIEGGGYLDMSVAILFVRASSEEEALSLFRDDVYVRAGVWTGELRAKPYGRTVLEPQPARRPAGAG